VEFLGAEVVVGLSEKHQKFDQSTQAWLGLVICHHVFNVHLVAPPGCNVRGMHPGFDHI
jgi:hypothetical protein